MASISACSLGSAEPTAPHGPPDGPPQLALLDFFFPGFSMFAGAIQKYLHIDLNIYIPIVLLAGVLTLLWSYASKYFWQELENHFMSVVDIRPNDEIYNIFLSWVASQQLSKGARRLIVNANPNLGFWCWWSWDEDEEDECDEAGASKKKKLTYTPSFGTHRFWYRGRLLQFRRTSNREKTSSLLASEEISLSCFGRDPWILKQLLQEARELYLNKDEQKTLIYRGTCKAALSDSSWQRCMARTPRPFSTVILNESKKKEIIDDIADYLCPATQRWYANRGIPYRRGYLLHGPPGTGKSSLSLALAGFFKMRIYIVSLNSIVANEETLSSLFAELPRRCVVLLEDIDTAGLTHTREEETDDSDEKKTSSNEKKENNNQPQPIGRLSLSGLLNILDGVASQEGRVLIMTTNHLEKLDKALIRPGRVDMTVQFSLADTEMTYAVFRAIFADLEADDEPVSRTDDLTSQEAKEALEEQTKKTKKREAHDAQINVLAEEFAARIPALEFSPAELQGFLMRHKRDPQAAVDNAQDFIERTRKDRKEKELREAEERRKAEEKKAEEKKAEEAKKKQEAEAEAKAQAKNSEEAKKENATQADGKAEESAPLPSTDGPAPGEKLQVETTSKIGHRRNDSGYVTPTSSDP